MAKKDKGFITWLFTIIALVLGFATAIASIGLAWDSLTGSVAIGELILSIIWLLLAIYFIWHGFMIVLGKASNSWLFVVLAFFAAALVGGILMLIAKIID